MAGLRATSSLWPSLLLVLIASLVTLAATPAHAEDSRKSAVARSLFEEGVSLGDRGDWVGAADRFARAYSLKPTSAVAFNWGSALMELGRLVEARELLWSVQQDPNANAELKRECTERLDTLAERLAHVRVHVPAGNRADLSLDLDDKPLPRAAWDVPSPVDPGTHTLVLREDGDERSRATVTLRQGEQRDVTLSLSEAAEVEQPAPFVATQPREDAPPKRPLYKNWKLWTAVGAVVVVGVVVAVVIAKSGEAGSATRGNTSPGVIRW
jgi:hypothetical protein